MKYLITLCLILISSSVFAYDMPLKTVNLDKKKIYLEDFLQEEEEESAQNQIKLRRTTDTPSKIQLGFALMANGDVCVKYRRTNVFRDKEDPYYNHYNRNRYGDRSYLFDKTCVEFERQSVGYNKWITLNFDKAKKLEKGEQELIRFSVSQYDINVTVINLDAEVINETETGYTIEPVNEGLFRNQGLTFISN